VSETLPIAVLWATHSPDVRHPPLSYTRCGSVVIETGGHTEFHPRDSSRI